MEHRQAPSPDPSPDPTSERGREPSPPLVPAQTRAPALEADDRPAPDARDLVAEATQRLLLSVDALAPDAWTADTELPGWTRAHVVAHLALNAEGLARALDGVRKGRRVPVYDSEAGRDADIEALAGRSPAEVRERLFAATAVLRDELAAMTADLEDVPVERHPGGPTYAALEAVPMRWREVEIHHVDLQVGYRPADWDPAFVAHLLPTAASDRADELDLVLRSPGGDVTVGDGSGPVLSGSAADLAWFLVRGGLAGLTGPVPTLVPWQRRPTPTPPAPLPTPTPAE